ncbi:MAG: DUF3343 domain-containing protein [Clostridia bacterium]|nr:DUF3343 domain-containing protein [Clostridia bacterium]
MKLILKFNSVTYALKAQSVLKRKRIKHKLTKNPEPKKGEGCGYIITVDNADTSLAAYLDGEGIAYKEAIWKDDLF